MKFSRTVLTAALGLGLATGLSALPASAATPAPAATAVTQTSATALTSTFTGSAQDEAASRAFYAAVMKSALARQAKSPSVATAVTVRYSTASAPSFRTQIARSAQIWNAAVTNVKLVESSSADFTYREGSDSRGSYASTDGHGRGYVFLDYAQTQQYDAVRVTAHETGHVLGLPDHYSGPCSELMSGGGPGPSCTNSQPNATERSRVNSLWANGISALADKGALTTIR